MMASKRFSLPLIAALRMTAATSSITSLIRGSSTAPPPKWAIGPRHHLTIMGFISATTTSAPAAANAIAAIKRDPRVSIIVSSVGTSIGPARSITAKGRVRILEDRETLDWVLPAISAAILPEAADVMQEQFTKMMDSSRRVVFEVTPEKWITFDAAKMMVASMTPREK